MLSVTLGAAQHSFGKKKKTHVVNVGGIAGHVMGARIAEGGDMGFLERVLGSQVAPNRQGGFRSHSFTFARIRSAIAS